jgi:glycerophosphoryl diester phosphodiesterase
MENGKLIVAHRGGKSRWHENTVEAIEEAILSGADMVEFDLRRTADGEIVVHHDEVIGGRSLVEMKYSEALRRSSDLGYRIPRASEVLDIASERIRIDIELKESGYEEVVLRLVFDRGFRSSDFVVTSFEVAALERVKHVSAGVRTGLLVYGVTGKEALERFNHTGADFLGPDYELLNELTLSAAAATEVPLLPWTVNDPVAIRTLLCSPAVIGIITDEPAHALAIRNDEAPRILEKKPPSWRKR